MKVTHMTSKSMYIVSHTKSDYDYHLWYPVTVPHGRSIILLEGNYIPFIAQENIVFGRAKSLVEMDIILPRGRLG